MKRITHLALVLTLSTTVVTGEILQIGNHARADSFDREKDLSTFLRLPNQVSEFRCIPLSDFEKKFNGMSGWAVVDILDSEENELRVSLYSEKYRSNVDITITWLENAESARRYFLKCLLRGISQLQSFWMYHDTVSIADFAVISKKATRSGEIILFLRGNTVSIAHGETTQDVLCSLSRKLDALLCGDAEFLPEDAAELVEIRKAWEQELERRRQKSHEAYLRRQQEWQAQERKRKAEELKTLSLAPTHQRELYKKLETRFELLKNHLKPRRVPAGTRDPDAWKKLSLKTVEPLFTKYEFSEKGVWHPFNFGFQRGESMTKSGRPNRLVSRIV